MRALSVSAGSEPPPATGSHSSVVVDVSSSPEDVFEAVINEDGAGKEVTARYYDSQTYRREKVWLNIFQDDRV